MSREKIPGKKQETKGKDQNQKETGFFTRPLSGGKSLWDWLTLLGVLAVPLILGIATIMLSNQQANVAQQQHDTDQRIANQQREDQQQAAILQTYLDNIQDLLIHNNLQKSNPGDEVALLARERTLTALQKLDPQRKGVLVQFLYDSNLIGYSDSFGQNIHPPIIILFGANLSDTKLAGANLKGADLIESNLSGADLSGADLSGAVIGEAHLSEADLRGAHLSDAQLYGADLKGANLFNADLSEAHLESANLSEANLSGANLSGADLFDADMSGTNIMQQQLDQVNSCQYTILPNGLICHYP